MPRIEPRFLLAVTAILVFAPAGAPTCRASSGMGAASSGPPAFGIVAVDSMRAEWGVAAVSRWIAVGARSLVGRAGAGAWLALELPDPRSGSIAFDLMARGTPARQALDSLLSGDPRKDERQIAVVDRAGTPAAFTGPRCPAWAGERIGKNYACQGVSLRDGDALAAMGRAFENASGTLGERLLAALDAAESIAPVREEVESAAVLVVREGGGPNGWADRLVDLRVDAASDAVQALKSLYATHAVTFLPAAYGRFGDEAKRRGDSISSEREYARAEAGFRAAVARKPKDPDALNELAWFLAAHDRDPDEAVRLATAAVAARPRDPNLYDTLAEAEYRSGSLTHAIEAMERAVKYSGGAIRYVDRLGRWTRERAALEGKAGTKTPGQEAR